MAFGALILKHFLSIRYVVCEFVWMKFIICLYNLLFDVLICHERCHKLEEDAIKSYCIFPFWELYSNQHSIIPHLRHSMAEIDCQETCLMKFLFSGYAWAFIMEERGRNTKTETTGGRTNITSSLSIGHS